jgi:hypothetical protein
MRIYLDLDSRRLLTTPTRPLSLLEFKRRDNDSIELQFLRDAVVQQLPAGTTARVGIKPDGDYDAPFLAVTTLTQTGTGTATVYSGELNLHTTAMATAFAGEPVTLPAMLEVEWVTGDVVSSSKTLPTTLHNDVIRGDEGTPADLPFFYTAQTSDFKSTQAQAEAGTDNATWMTPLRTAQAIAELAATDWDSVSGKPSTFPPATHTHTVADTTGLQVALDGKAATSHTHPLSQLTQSSATPGQVATWNGTAWVPQTPSGGGSGGTPSAHASSHATGGSDAITPASIGAAALADLTDLQTAIDGKQDAGDYAASNHQHSAADITSDTLALARIPTGTTSSTVALGNHTHTFGTTSGTYCQGNDSRLLTLTGGITAISVVTAMPTSPVANTLYIVTA